MQEELLAAREMLKTKASRDSLAGLTNKKPVKNLGMQCVTGFIGATVEGCCEFSAAPVRWTNRYKLVSYTKSRGYTGTTC